MEARIREKDRVGLNTTVGFPDCSANLNLLSCWISTRSLKMKKTLIKFEEVKKAPDLKGRGGREGGGGRGGGERRIQSD